MILTRVLQRLLLALLMLFGIAGLIATIGIAFNVNPPFSLAWAGSGLLFLEGGLLIVAAMLRFGISRGITASLLVILLSYAVEAVGVNTGIPFGSYRYTDILFPRLPGGVPLAVMFAWVLIVLGGYGWVQKDEQPPGVHGVLLGATLATLLDLEIEPVAVYLEHYWQWLIPGPLNYYGVPLANFIAWFVVALLLLLMVDAVLRKGLIYHTLARHPRNDKGMINQTPTQDKTYSNLATLAPRLLFATSLSMFGLADLTHGYYVAALLGLLAGVILYARSRLWNVETNLFQRVGTDVSRPRWPTMPPRWTR